MKKLTDNTEKIELVSKLVKDGNIDFAEAIKLLEEEVEKEFVYVPYQTIEQPHIQPYTIPYNPILPFYNQPSIIVGGISGGIGAIGGVSIFNTPITCMTITEPLFMDYTCQN